MTTRNVNLEERLQIINDYIQRSIDALNVTRQVAAGLTGYPIGVGQVGLQGNIGHNTFGLYGLQQLGSPSYGFVNPYLAAQGYSAGPQLGIPQPGFGHPQQTVFGVQHSPYAPSPYAPPSYVQPQLAGWPLVQGPVSWQHAVPGYGFGPAVQHSPFVQAPFASPQLQSAFGSPWAIPGGQWVGGPSPFGYAQAGQSVFGVSPSQVGINHAGSSQGTVPGAI